jgi:hypothetical protein
MAADIWKLAAILGVLIVGIGAASFESNAVAAGN